MYLFYNRKGYVHVPYCKLLILPDNFSDIHGSEAFSFNQ